GPVERRDLPVSEGRPTGDCFREEWAGPKDRPTSPIRVCNIVYLREKVFEPYPPGRADAEKHGVSAISPAHLTTCIRLSRTRPRPAASRAMPWVSAADHGVAKAGQGRARPRLLRDAVRGLAAGGGQRCVAVAGG